jgi:hypothetical protein
MRKGVRKEPRGAGLFLTVAVGGLSQATDAGKLMSRVAYPHAYAMLSQANDNEEQRTMRTKTALAIVPFATQVPSSATLLHRIWPPAVLVIGLALTLAWTALLGYRLVNAVALAF